MFMPLRKSLAGQQWGRVVQATPQTDGTLTLARLTLARLAAVFNLC
jgi:hypothetical protein